MISWAILIGKTRPLCDGCRRCQARALVFNTYTSRARPLCLRCARLGRKFADAAKVAARVEMP